MTALVLLRQPLALARPQFIWEEAAAFWATTFTFDPVTYLVQPWAGYFQIIPRAAFIVARLGPPELAPAVTIATHAIIIGIVAAFLASDRMATAIPDRRIRVAFRVSIGLLPFAEAYLSVLSIQWFLALMLVGMSLSPPRRWDYPVIVLAGLSGMGAVLALPLFWRDRRGLALLAVAAVQGVVVLSSGRLSGSLHVEPISLLIIAVVAIVLLVPRTLPLRTRLAFGYLAIVTLGAAVFTFGNGGRYSLAAAAAIVLVAIAATVQRRPIGVVIAGLVVAAIVVSLPLPSVIDTHWSEHAHCIGGPTPCLVPVVPEAWSVSWDPRGYVAPRGLGPDAGPLWPDGRTGH